MLYILFIELWCGCMTEQTKNYDLLRKRGGGHERYDGMVFVANLKGMEMKDLGYKLDINKVSFIGQIKTYDKTHHFFTIVIDGVKMDIEHSGDIATLEFAKKELDAAFEDIYSIH